MPKRIAISTNKGGVLKTSITTNIAAVLAGQERKVLIIDTDNQGNASLSYMRNPDDFNYSLYDVLVDGLAADYVIQEAYKNIDILPSNDDMAFFEFDVLTNQKDYPRPFHLLREAMKGLESKYDYILVDTPPNMGLTQGNVLSYVDEVLIPFQPEPYSMRSLIKIRKAINEFKEEHNPNLEILGVVGTLVDARTSLHSQVLQECRRFCDENEIKLFNTVIPRSVRFAASIAYDRLPAVLTDKKHPIVKSYFELVNEVLAQYIIK